MQTQLQFDNRFLEELPGDSEPDNFVREVRGACYSRVRPTPVRSPTMVAFSPETANLLGIEATDCTSDTFLQVLAGNKLLPGMDPFAMCYGGHQFGNWAGQLGDGRAINLGDVVTSDRGRYAMQLKGAGPTPYSRTADGLAVLRSSLREFLCSEAMHHLGVPTTRALSLTLTGEEVVRDILYDGHPKAEPGAIVCRVAPTFLRFGNFELLASRRESELLRDLADYTIKTHFPESGPPGKPSTYIDWFRTVVQLTATMVVQWMRVGFVHGVMNTDNMSILGLTIDYGPYGWLENYDPNWTPNTTDAAGRRYRFGQQPAIAQWNLLQFANAIYPLIGEAKPLENALSEFASLYESEAQQMMANKLGLLEFRPRDKELLDGLENVLSLAETDMTLFYRGLAEATGEMTPTARFNCLHDAFYTESELTDPVTNEISRWLGDYLQRVSTDDVSDQQRRDRMNQVNPLYVLRNYRAQLAIDAAGKGNFSAVNELLDVLRNPYTEQPHRDEYAAKRPEWARHRVGCSMLSCSS